MADVETTDATVAVAVAVQDKSTGQVELIDQMPLPYGSVTLFRKSLSQYLISLSLSFSPFYSTSRQP